MGGAIYSTNGLGALMYSVGTLYDLTKSANLYAAFYGVSTRDSSSYGIFPSPGTVTPGAKSRGVGIGILYSF